MWAWPRGEVIFQNLRGPELEESLRVFCVSSFYRRASCAPGVREEDVLSKSSFCVRISSPSWTSVLRILRHLIKEYYKIVFISHVIAQSLLSFLNLEFQIPDVHSCNKYLLSKFRVPGTLQQITKSSVSALPSWCLCLFGKSVSFRLHTHWAFLLSFLSLIKDVRGTEDTVVDKTDNSFCGAED